MTDKIVETCYKTTCDICGKEIIGVENFINAGDKVVCSEECKQKAYFNDYVEHCEIGMGVDEITEIKKMNEKLKKKPRMTCKRHCPVWNDIDKDCEIYGEHHFTPRTCPFYKKEIEEVCTKELKQDD
jgi:hypothetical protein